MTSSIFEVVLISIVSNVLMGWIHRRVITQPTQPPQLDKGSIQHVEHVTKERYPPPSADVLLSVRSDRAVTANLPFIPSEEVLLHDNIIDGFCAQRRGYY